MTSVCMMNWISSPDEPINLFHYTYWHFKWVWKVWVQMAILLKFLIMQLCWKESCYIKVCNYTMIHIFYIHLNSYTYSISLLLTGSNNQFPNYEFWIFTNFSTNEKKIYKLFLVFICWNLDPVTKIVSIQAAKPNHNGLTYFSWRFKRQRRRAFKNGVKRTP